jgi:spermidine synthase
VADERAEPSSFPLAAPPLYFLTTAAMAVLATGYEVTARQPQLYLVLDSGARRSAFVGAAVGAVAGFCVGRTRKQAANERLPWVLCAASLLAASSAWFWFVAAAQGGFGAVAIAVPTAISAALALALHDATLVLWGTVLRLNGLPRLLNPFRLLASAAAALIVATSASAVGALRTGAALALVLAVLALWWLPLSDFLAFPMRRRRRFLQLVCAAAVTLELLSFALAERVLPAAEQAQFANPVVLATSADEDRLVVTSGQDAVELFSQGELRISSLDAYRYSEALVHPAAVTAARRERALVIRGGSGVIEKELLRYRAFRSVTVLAESRAIVELSQSSDWLRALSDDALRDSRIRIVLGEALPWLERTSEHYDVIIVDARDPADAIAGKYYTRYFFSLLRQRLSPAGVASLQAASSASSPRAQQAMVASARAAELEVLRYAVPIPTLGEWGFLLLSRGPLHVAAALPPDLRFLDTPGLQRLLVGLAEPAPQSAPVSLLHDQSVVTAFDNELAATPR